MLVHGSGQKVPCKIDIKSSLRVLNGCSRIWRHRSRRNVGHFLRNSLKIIDQTILWSMN